MTALPEVDDPALSVVMVTHGAWSLTEQAIAALAENTEPRFELIVVDNDSPDETRSRLSAIRNVRVILNDHNEGFGPATNRGAAVARGEYLVLLNTDAFVQPGWLEPLCQALEDPVVGAVVPVYLHQDGSLQDAGTLLAQDGTVLVYGDGDSAERGCYRFRRVVDSGAAACMAIRNDLFQALGGFDPRYAPAYYEDADLCLRIAEHGLDVVYEPRSAVTHLRYGSGGFDQAVELSNRNRRLFVDLWGPQLIGRPWTFRGTTEQAVIAARDARATPRLLIFAPPSDVAAELALLVLRSWPRARVTWATGADGASGFDAGPLLHAGVEMLDEADPAWLRSRLFHYELVVLGTGVDDELVAALRDTQPQAAVTSLAELEHPTDAMLPRLITAMAGAGIAPPA